MQDKDTTKSTFFQLFQPILNKKFLQKLQTLNIDKYIKKRKIDHEAIFKYTLRQVLTGQADHLNDLIYDPVIL